MGDITITGEKQIAMRLKNFFAEAFIWTLLATLVEVWVTATIERFSMGSDYIMSSVPWYSLQGHTTMWQVGNGIVFPLGIRLVLLVYQKLKKEVKWFRSVWRRALVTMIIIYICEYFGGLFANKLLKMQLWDYSQYVINGIPLHLHGQITIVYAPFWYIAGILLKPVYEAVHKLAPYVGKTFDDLF